MDRNLHDIEDSFKRAYHSYQHSPSAKPWEKINAALDKEEADKYKRRLLGWKRTAVLLFCLLTGLLIYDTESLIKHNKNSNLRETITNANSVSSVRQQNGVFENSVSVAEQGNSKGNENKITGENNLDVHRETATANDHQQLSQWNSTLSNETRNMLIDGNDPTNQSISISGLAMDPATISETGEIRSPGFQFERLAGPEINHRLHQLTTVESPAIRERNTIAVALNSINKVVRRPFRPYWSSTAFASNDWSQYLLDNDAKDNMLVPQNEKEKISLREKHEASFSLGVFVTRQLSRHIGLKAAVVYSNIAISISPQEIYAVKDADGNINYKYIASSGYGYVKPGFGQPPAIGDSLHSTEAQHNLYTFSIPLMILYRWEQGRISMSPSVGLSANLISKAKIKTEIRDALNKETISINRLNGARSFYLGLVSDLNVQYKVSNRWSFILFPGFKYAITPITRSHVVKTYPYSFSMGLGVNYSL